MNKLKKTARRRRVINLCDSPMSISNTPYDRKWCDGKLGHKGKHFYKVEWN